MNFSPVDQNLFNELIEKLIAALDKLTPPTIVEVTRKI